jgi:hypothetical protein
MDAGPAAGNNAQDNAVIKLAAIHVFIVSVHLYFLFPERVTCIPFFLSGFFPGRVDFFLFW